MSEVPSLPVGEILPELRARLASGRNAVLVAPPGAGKSTVVPLALLDEPWATGKRVLLLEAGGRDNWIWFHIPVGYLHCIGNPRTDWLLRTEADPGLNGRALIYPRGKVLGGSLFETVPMVETTATIPGDFDLGGSSYCVCRELNDERL